MKKLKKELKKILRVFLALSLLFNNLMPLSVVFADELDNNDEVIVGKAEDDTVIPSDEGEVGEEKPVDEPAVEPADEPTDEPIVEPADEPADEPVVEELVYTVTLNDSNQIVIKHNKALDLSEESKLIIIEDIKYVDNATYGGEEAEVELTEEVRNALVSEEGYVFDSVVLEDNPFEGEYSVNVTIDEEQRTASKTIAAEGEGIEFKLYTSAGEEIIPDDAGIYYIESGNSSFKITGRLLNGGISPTDKFTINGEEFTAYEMFEEGTIAEELLEGYLYGEFNYDLSFTYTMGDAEKAVNETFDIMYGDYQENTDNLNDSAKNVGLDTRFVFYGYDPYGTIYYLSDEEIESVLDDFVGDSEIISYTVNNENGLKITLTDGRVTITYESAVPGDEKVAAKLESDSTEVNSGDTIKVEYIATVGENNPFNGFSGVINYDETLLKLVNVEVSDCVGGNEDGEFLYAGKLFMYDVQFDDDGNATISEKDHVLMTLTFEALQSGEATVSIEDAKFYDYDLYYGAEDEISTAVTINVAADNTLQSLTVAGQEIELQDGVYEYEITVSSDVTSADVEAIVSNVAASVTSIVSPEELVEGENIITIVVTAENGEEQEYTVKVIKEKATEEETAEQFNNQQDNDDIPTVGPDNSNKTNEDDGKKEEPVKEESKLSRIIIIILILLVIAGLIYLIFKDDDDDETKKANKDIDRLKNEDITSKENNTKKSDTKPKNKNTKKER